jgi:hypothetical protein
MARFTLEAILWIFSAYAALTFICFLTAVYLLISAAGHGRRDELPTHARFNPLNVILYPATLDERGQQLRKHGLRFLKIFVIAVIFSGIAGVIIELAQVVLDR